MLIILIPTNRTRGARGGLRFFRTLRLRGDSAPRDAPSGRVHPAPISFPIFCGSSPHPPPPKGKWKKGNGCGLLRRFVLQKLRKVAKYPLLPISAFSVLAATRGAPVSAFGGNSCVRSHYASTSHWHARIRSRRLLGVASCSLFRNYYLLYSNKLGSESAVPMKKKVYLSMLAIRFISESSI
mgnify:CR=1 FL=1